MNTNTAATIINTALTLTTGFLCYKLKKAWPLALMLFTVSTRASGDKPLISFTRQTQTPEAKIAPAATPEPKTE